VARCFHGVGVSVGRAFVAGHWPTYFSAELRRLGRRRGLEALDLTGAGQFGENPATDPTSSISRPVPRSCPMAVRRLRPTTAAASSASLMAIDAAAKPFRLWCGRQDASRTVEHWLVDHPPIDYGDRVALGGEDPLRPRHVDRARSQGGRRRRDLRWVYT